jgi:hypothetical protein
MIQPRDRSCSAAIFFSFPIVDVSIQIVSLLSTNSSYNILHNLAKHDRRASGVATGERESREGVPVQSRW